MTFHVPDELAERLRPLGRWLPTVLELSLAGFDTIAAATAAAVIQFLSSSPSLEEVLTYHVSDSAQTRLRRLLTLNEAGMLGEEEQPELDELQLIEHIVAMLKLDIVQQLTECEHGH